MQVEFKREERSCERRQEDKKSYFSGTQIYFSSGKNCKKKVVRKKSRHTFAADRTSEEADSLLLRHPDWLIKRRSCNYFSTKKKKSFEEEANQKRERNHSKKEEESNKRERRKIVLFSPRGVSRIEREKNWHKKEKRRIDTRKKRIDTKKKRIDTRKSVY